MPPFGPTDNLLEIWERIAFYTVDDFLGPPSDICCLVAVSRRMNQQLSWKHNTHLYARIFRLKFDTSASSRRLSERWLTTGSLTSELIKRFEALKRIRAKQFKVEDLWTAYIMMMENDGKNESQLLQYSSLGSYLQTLIVFRIGSRELAWFANPTIDCLTVWLLWYLSDRDDLRNEPVDYRQYVIGILHSVIAIGYRHSSVYASECYFSLPFCENATFTTLPGALPPPTSEITHYSHSLRISAPIISSAAMMALAARFDAFKDETNIPHPLGMPANRAEAMIQGKSGATLEDVHDFHLNNKIPLRERRTGTQHSLLYDDAAVEEDGASKCYDEDWYRLVACHDLRVGDTPLRGVIYQLGSIVGKWAGRLTLADFELHTSLLNSQRIPSTVSLRHAPLYWELQEHHCLIPNEPLPPGIDEGEGEDFLNAWLPRGAVFKHLEDSVEVFDPNTGHTARYDTFLPGNVARSDSYSKAASEKVQRSWISDGDAPDGEIAEKASACISEIPDSPSYIDDDGYEDTVSFVSSGVSDIIITGKTGERYGEAWGHCEIVGRIRPWDGLVVLLRISTDGEGIPLGKWIFRGYLHGQNFVGRWRETLTPIDLIGYEGGFVVFKT